MNEDAAVEILHRICETVPDQDCVHYLSLPVSLVLDELKQVDTDQICTIIGECREEDGRSSTLESFKSVATVTGLEIAPLCRICRMTLTVVHNFLSNQRIQGFILGALKKVCDLTGPLKKKCQYLVGKYGSLVIALAQEVLVPELCNTIYLCDITQPVKAVDISGGIFCSVCKRLTHIVEALISDKDNERRVIALTKLMCKKLPSPFSYMCDGFASFILPEVFDFLRTNKKFLDNLCKTLHLCPSKELLIGSKTTILVTSRREKESKTTLHNLLFVPSDREGKQI